MVMKTKVIGPDVVLEVAHRELVEDGPLVPNARRERRYKTTAWGTPAGDLYGPLEDFRVRTALVRTDAWEDVEPIQVRSRENVESLLRSISEEGMQSPRLVVLALSGAMEVHAIQSVRTRGEHDMDLATHAVKMALITGSPAIVCIYQTDSLVTEDAQNLKYVISAATDCVGVSLLDVVMANRAGELLDFDLE